MTFLTLRTLVQGPLINHCAGRCLHTTSRAFKNLSSSITEEADPPLSLLSRPLGVVETPTTVAKTRKEKLQNLINHDAIIAERRHIIKEAGKGYFDDLNNTRRHGGKTWIAPKSMIREDKALYLPNIVGKSLDTGERKHTTTMCAGRITILAMLSTKISEIHAKGFVEPSYERYKSNPLFQYIQINLQENLLKSFLVNLFTNSLRTTVLEELHSVYLVSNQNMEYVREPMGMTNSKVGYVYLIDEKVRIRWGGSADAMLEEAVALETCTGVLLKRLQGQSTDPLDSSNRPSTLP